MRSRAHDQLSKEMEEKIFKAATSLFVLKGKAGTSMQDIADEAGINRTLVNYYFRSKENLFDQVFSHMFSLFIPRIISIMESDIPVRKRMEAIIDHYFDILIQNPVLPLFILQELSSDPERLANRFRSVGLHPDSILRKLESEMDRENQKSIDMREIMINMLSLIIFPFAARRIFEKLLFTGNTDAYAEYLNQRRINLKKLVEQLLKPL